MSDSITVPPRAAAHLSTIVTERQQAEARLQQAIALLSGALDIPDGWQLRIEPDGSMAFVAPVAAPALPAAVAT